MPQRLQLRTTVTRKIAALKTLADQFSQGITQTNVKNLEKAEDVIFALNVVLGQIRSKRRLLYECRKAKKQAKKLTSSLAIEIDRSFGGSDKQRLAKYRTSLALKNYSQLMFLESRLDTSVAALTIESRKLEKQALALGLKI